MNHCVSWTSKHKHSEQYTILGDFQAKELQSIDIYQILVLKLSENWRR